MRREGCSWEKKVGTFVFRKHTSIGQFCWVSKIEMDIWYEFFRGFFNRENSHLCLTSHMLFLN